MFSNDYIAYAIIAVGIFTVYMAVMNLFRSDQMQSRVKNAAGASFTAMSETSEEKPPALAQLCEYVLSIMKVDVNAQKELALSLSRAGIESPYAITYALFFKWVIQPLLLLAGVWFCFKTLSSGVNGGALRILVDLVILSFLIIFGLNGTKLYIGNRKKKRQLQLRDSFPEVLDLLLVCIESGLGLDAALNRVCKELRAMHPVVISELDRTRLELTMLGDRVVALQNLAERAEIIPVRTLVSSLIQTEKFGTSLVETLRVLSEEQRLTRLFSAEQKAARIPVLITIPLILFIMPAFIMIILGPPIIRVIDKGGLLPSNVAGKR